MCPSRRIAKVNLRRRLEYRQYQTVMTVFKRRKSSTARFGLPGVPRSMPSVSITGPDAAKVLA
jgi:hypothetical protein